MSLSIRVREVAGATPRASIVRLDLVGHPFPFKAGQAVVLGAPQTSLRRPYSIASSPGDVARTGALELLVGLDAQGRAGGDLALEPGREVLLEGPLGSFTFPDAPDERRFLFIAGGTGIAPLRSMLRQALDLEGASTTLVYSARTAHEFAFGEEFRALARAGQLTLLERVTREPEGDSWTGARGRAGEAELRPLVQGPETLCFVCGPQSMVKEVPPLLVALGLERRRVRIEEW